jgi:hypothetical protein
MRTQTMTTDERLLREELAEVAAVAKGCAKREAQYYADCKDLLVALKRCRISLNLVADERFNPAGHRRIKDVTDIIDEALASARTASSTREA